MSDTAPKRELTGRHVLFMLLAFFGVMLIVNGVFTVFAVKSFTGEDVPKSYHQGIEYNKTIEARRAQTSLNWTVTANHYPSKEGVTTIVVNIATDEAEAPKAMSISGVARHPTDKAFDQTFDMRLETDGHYRVDLPLSKGDWSLLMNVRGDGKPVYKFKHRLWVN